MIAPILALVLATAPVAPPRQAITQRVRSVESAAAVAHVGLRGTASWFRAPAGTAAAGPALRAALGVHWRGQRVRLCGPAGCATVRLTDWMRADRLVDLNPGAFRAVCGPLSRGLCVARAIR